MAANNDENVEYAVTYMECLRNHATHTMYYVVDGCGLFEASGPNGTPEAMVCAACQCHRNFHRAVVVELPPVPAPLPHPQAAAVPVRRRANNTSNHADDPVIEVDLQARRAPNRTRPRITPQQSEGLRSYAERNNWKMFREHSKEEVGRICSTIGIEEITLKRWISYHRRRRMKRMQAAVRADQEGA